MNELLSLNPESLLPRALPLLCLLLLYLALRMRVGDWAISAQGGIPRGGRGLRFVFSLLLVLAAAGLWLWGPKLLPQLDSHAVVMLQPEAAPKKTAVPVSPPVERREPVARPRPSQAAPASLRPPKIMASSKGSVIIEHQGVVLTVRLGNRTPDGWEVVSVNTRQVIFQDDQGTILTMGFDDASGEWKPVP